MTSEAKKAAKARYDAKTAKFYSLKLNVNTDGDIIDYLQKQESTQGTIKALIRAEISREQKEEEKKMKITAYTTEGKAITVEISTDAVRHVVIGGQEIDLAQRRDPETERAVDAALDDLHDMPIYEDGTIHTGKGKHVFAWQAASIINEEEKKMISIQFEAGTSRDGDYGVNYLIAVPSSGEDLYAEIRVPDGASDDFGYLVLKQEILRQAAEAGIPADRLAFQYDGQEDRLSPDADGTLRGLWYAVQRDREDDWSTGSYDREKALEMARKLRADYPDALIAVIDNTGTNPVCVDEITDLD